MGRRLAGVACGDKEGVDVLLIHTPWVGDPVMASGCVPAQLSGHLHVRYGPEQKGEGVRYISASTAGAAFEKATIGPLQGVAEMTVLRWDTRTHRFVDYQLVSVSPSTQAEVGTRQPWPVPRSLEELRPPQPGPTPL
jgi:hypothetical protein